ncbi:MAG: hypothetical protein J5762_05245, partial [Clostridia bacterium]|nr:hypothetical protein [Clostridia bacterium]
PEKGYELDEITVYIDGFAVRDTADLAALMGDAVFQGEDRSDWYGMDDYSSRQCKVVDGVLALVEGDDIVCALTDTIEVDFYPGENNPNIGSVLFRYGEYSWTIVIENRVIIEIQTWWDNNGMIFISTTGRSTGELNLTLDDVITVTEGKVYTFDMPSMPVRIVATFAESDEHDHDETTLEYVPAKAATCTEAGNTAYYRCIVCGLYYADVNGETEITLESTVIAATGHDYQFVEFVWDSFTAQAKYVCTHDDTHVELHNATVTSQITTEPTCTIAGVKTYTATYDGHTDTQTEDGAALGHDVIHHDAQAATCTSVGWNAYDTCSRCDYTTYQEIKPLGHAIVRHDAKAATCTEVGWDAYVSCSRCDFSTYVEIPALGHEYAFDSFVWDGFTAQAKYVCAHDNEHVELHNAVITSEVTKAATCLETGVRTYTATYDGHTDTKTETLTALGHDLVHHDAQAATCTEIGWNAYDTCSRCDYSTYEEIAALGHDWGEWTVVKVATVEEEGLKRRVCAHDANHVEERVIPKVDPHVHNYVFDSFVWDGFTAKAKYVCTENDEHVDLRDAVVTNEVTKAATCEETGVKVYTATYDGHTDTKNETLAALGHDLEHHDAQAATCTAIGWNAYDTCSRCDYTTYQEIAALGHDYKFDSFVWEGFTAKAKYVCANDNTHVELRDAIVTNEVTTAATCDDAGVRTYTATHEGHTEAKTEVIAALGHDIIHHDGKAATCTEIGWDEYETCSRCGFSTYEEIPALGHFVSEWIVTKEPTCIEKGSKHKICTVCGTEIEVEEIEANGHTADEWVTTKEPTCTEIGSKHIVCAVCDEELEVAEIDALGHDYQSVVTAPTCTERGYTTHTCSRCNDSYVDTYVDALGHNFGEWTVTKEAQEDEKGEEKRTCSTCGATLTREIEANGKLTYVETVTEEPKDVTELFTQAKEEEGFVEIKATTEDNKELVIVFDNSAVQAIGDANVTLSAKVVTENVTVENAELVLEVKLEGATFEGGEAKVSIPFEKEVPTGKVAKVYYIADDGTRTDMNATLVDGKIVFTTNHFSTYVIAFEDKPVEPSDSTDTSDTSASASQTTSSSKKFKGCFGSISGGSIAVFGIVMAGLMILLKKKERNE